MKTDRSRQRMGVENAGAKGRGSPINPLVARRGMGSCQEFLKGLEAFLGRIPELRSFAEVAAAHGCRAYLSGGTARVVLQQYLRVLGSTEPEKPLPTSALRLTDVLDGSDLDGLLERPAGKVDKQTVDAVSTELNRRSGAALVATLPGHEGRYCVAEFDLADIQSFRALNRRYGGETVSLIALGLDEQGRLVTSDPYGGIRDFYQGTLRYAAGRDPYSEDLVVSGVMDPSLDGLRLIRAVGEHQEVGLRPTASATRALNRLGKEANRRLWEIRARISHPRLGGDAKLERRWRKYVRNVFSQFRSPADARRLLDRSGYSDVLVSLGMKDLLKDTLRKQRPLVDPILPASQAVAGWTKSWRGALEAAVVSEPPEVYLWTGRKHGEALAGGAPPAAQDSGALGAGLYLTDPAFPDRSAGAVLLHARIAPGTRWLDLDQPAAKAAIADYLTKLEPHFVAQQDDRLDPERDARSAAFDALWAELQLDGVFSKSDSKLCCLVLHQGALTEFSWAHDFRVGLLEQLRNGQLGDRTELGVRALLAMDPAGLGVLDQLLDAGTVKLEQLFPPAARQSLFECFPEVDQAFAGKLENRLDEPSSLSPEQVALARRAVEHLRGRTAQNPDRPSGESLSALKQTGRSTT